MDDTRLFMDCVAIAILGAVIGICGIIASMFFNDTSLLIINYFGMGMVWGINGLLFLNILRRRK